MSSQAWLGTVLALALLVLLALLFVVRLRSVAGRLGSFECAWRPSHTTRWSSGVSMFTNDALRWYRLMSLAPSPARIWARGYLEMGPARRRGAGSKVVEVPCTSGDVVFELAMHEDSHSALVAWLESTAPR